MRAEELTYSGNPDKTHSLTSLVLHPTIRMEPILKNTQDAFFRNTNGCAF
jgi:hypothetical protein